MESRRQKKLESLITKEVEEIIRREVSDPRIGFFTITSVRVTADFKNARISVSFLGSEAEKQRSFAGLKSAQGYIQRKLAQRLFIRFSPALEFVYDERKEFRIEELLSEIRKERDERDETSAD